MTRCWKSTIFAASIAVILSTIPCFAQNPATQQAAAGVQVALVDIGYVFKNYGAFKNRYDQIKADASAFEKNVMARRQQIMDERKKLEDLNADSPDYKRIEQDMAHKMSDLQVEMSLKRKEILQKEAQINLNAYQEIKGVVEKLANHYGISLVLRYDGEQMDAKDRNSVMKGLNRHVIYQKNLDITQMVLKHLPQEVAGNVTPSPRPRPGVR